MSNIGERIKLIRKAKNLTQQKFAERIGTKQNTIAQYEIGRNVPMDPVITSICREFRIREEWLREGKGDMEVDDSQREKLENFFSDVLTTAPDERSAFVAALDNLPPEFWPMFVELAKKVAAEYKEKG